MSSDIELGEDESITFACSEVRNRRAGGQPVDWRGDIKLKDRVFLYVPSYAEASSSTSLHGYELSDAAAGLLGSTSIPATVATISSSYATGIGGKVVSSKLSVFDRLRRDGYVDVATELATLRAAILELHDRVGGLK
jgi:hypothetical protein